MTVESKHHRYFVAKRGEILRNIGEEFGGVVVSFPRPGVTSDKVNTQEGNAYPNWFILQSWNNIHIYFITIYRR